MSPSVSRSIIDAIHSGALATASTTPDLVFGFEVVIACPNVPPEILLPRQTLARPVGLRRGGAEAGGAVPEELQGLRGWGERRTEGGGAGLRDGLQQGP
jgi:hypothetical protein